MNNLNLTKKPKGRPKLTNEEKILQLEKRKEYQRNYRIQNKEEISKKYIEYVNNNIDKIKTSKQNHYINNKERYIENAKKHRLKSQEESKQNKLLIEQLLNENKILNDLCKKI